MSRHYLSVASTFRVLLPALALSGAAACASDEPLPVWVDLNYQLGCSPPECAGFHGEPHMVQVVDGENGFETSCSSVRSGGATLVTMRARKGGEQLFELSSVLFGDVNSVGTACHVKIIDGDNTYEGSCSTAAPTFAVPCQITDFGKSSYGRLEGKLYCDNIKVASAPDITRDVVRAGTAGSAPQPAEFKFDPCEGL